MSEKSSKPSKAANLFVFDPEARTVIGIHDGEIELHTKPGVKFFTKEAEAKAALEAFLEVELARKAQKASARSKVEKERIARLKADPKTWKDPYLREAEKTGRLAQAIATLLELGLS